MAQSAISTSNLVKWAEALRSGEFKQDREVRGFLWRGKNNPPTELWSAFGVLCELFRREVGGNWRFLPVFEGEHAFNDRGLGALGPKHVLPDAVIKWSGLSSGQFSDLFWMVRELKPFEDIATVLEGWAKGEKKDGRAIQSFGGSPASNVNAPK